MLGVDKPARLSFSCSLDLLLNENILCSDIDQTNINRDIRDGNWLSSEELSEKVEEAERPSASLCSRSLTAKEERKETEVKLETIVLSLRINFFS